MTAGEKRRASTDKEEEERLQKQARGSEGGGSDDQPQKQEVLTADRPKSESPEGKGAQKGAKKGEPEAGDRSDKPSEPAATASGKAKAAEKPSDSSKAEGDADMAEPDEAKDGAEKGDADMTEQKPSPANEVKGTPKGKAGEGDKAGSAKKEPHTEHAEEGGKSEKANKAEAADQKNEEKAAGDEPAAEGGDTVKGEEEGKKKAAGGVKEEAEDDDSMYEAYSAHQQQHQQQQGGAEAEGEEVISKVKAETVLEKGRVIFFYRPKVQQEHPDSIDDVQRFHLVLQPTATTPTPPEAVEQAAEKAEKEEGGGSKAEQDAGAGLSEGPVVRLITIGKKKLPDISRHERMFAFVSAVGRSVEEVTSGLGAKEYETATRGKRSQPAARVAASGVYTICLKERGAKKGRAANETVLAYELELPGEGHEGAVQKELNIGHTGTFHIQVKNPEIQGSSARSEGAPTAGPTPQYTPTQLALFHGRRWCGALDVKMLDQQGAELILIGARPSPAEEVDQAAAEELRETVQADEAQAAAAGAGEGEGEGHASKKQKTGGGEEAAVAERLHEEIKGAGVEEKPAQTGEWA